MSLRSRVADFLLADQKAQLARAAEVLTDAYQRGPLLMSPEVLLQRLAEVDSRYVDLLARQLQHGGRLIGYEATETDRLRTVDLSRRMYDVDVITETILDIWTDFGYGVNLEVTPRDKAARGIWSAFWKRPINSYVLGQRNIHVLSNRVLRDGDLLFLFFISTHDGTTTVRTVETHEIRGGPQGDGVVTLPDDASVPVLYRREVKAALGQPAPQYPVLYYRDHRATPEMIERALPKNSMGRSVPFSDGPLADEVNKSTKVVALFAAHRARKLRGWPLMTTGMPWSSAYKDFLQDRAAVAKSAAMYFDKIKAKGGQRAIDLITQSLQSSYAGSSSGSERNPQPVAGSTWVENEQLERSRFPTGTGAGDAALDSAALMGQAGLAGRVYPHWLGRGEAFRLATSTSMEAPTLRAFNRYQLFWSSVWGDMAQIVLTAHQDYGRPRRTFETMEVDVNTDALLSIDVNTINVVASTLEALTSGNLLPQDVAQQVAPQLLRVALQTLGVRNIDDVLRVRVVAAPPVATAAQTASTVDPLLAQDDIQAQALNGAQVASLLDIAAQYSRGELTLESARAIIVAAFPTIPLERINAILAVDGTRPPGATQEAYMSESVPRPDAYRSNLRRAVRALWMGESSASEFESMMSTSIRRGLTLAWYAGAEAAGVKAEEITPEELAALQDAISAENEYIAGFADAIKAGSKSAGGLLTAFDSRLDQWARRWGELRTRAQVMAGADQKFRWTVNDEAEHCDSCQALRGKIKRGSTWTAAGITPRCDKLECGRGCKCDLKPTDQPVTRGKLPQLKGASE